MDREEDGKGGEERGRRKREGGKGNELVKGWDGKGYGDGEGEVEGYGGMKVEGEV